MLYKENLLDNEKVKFFPELAHLEMARAAIAYSVHEQDEAILLKDIIWNEPITVGANGEQVHIALYPDNQGEISWEIYKGSENEEYISASSIGKARVIPMKEAKSLDIQKIKSICNSNSTNDIENEKNVAEVWTKDESCKNISSHILVKFDTKKDDKNQDFKESVILEPKLLEACLHVVRSYVNKKGQEVGRLLNIKEVEVVAKSMTSTWAFIEIEDRNVTSEGELVLNIELLDEAGEIVSSIKDMHYKLQEVEQETELETSSAAMKKPGKRRRLEMKGLQVQQCILWEVKNKVSLLLKIPMNKLDISESLTSFGFDSISLIELAGELNECFDIEITPSLFFNYPTIESVSEYFYSNYSAKMEEFYQEGTEIEELQGVSYKHDKTEDNIKNIKIHRGKSSRSSQDDKISESIAIIGMSGKFSDAENIDEFWSILEGGKESIHTITDERLALWQENENLDKLKNKDIRIGLIPGVDEFDPLFFDISPREAERMDPRQRILLEETWKALEDAGYGRESLTNEKIGMFVGAENGDYRTLISEEDITSNNDAVLAGRLAYFLNLHGPNMAINTACSSGMVAVHEACLSLRNGECDTAIAAGVNLLITPNGYKAMDKAGMLSADGSCYAFDKRADGMVPAEAVAVVVLKRISKAEKDHNPIYATIVGSGTNYDGKTSGITAPSGTAQTELIKEVYKHFHINPEEISYIVSHGTGTKLGDPIEMDALVDAFKGFANKENSIAVTSTKPNIGHTMAASGVVSLISLAMSMKKEKIPASINFEQMNDFINLKGSPFYINQENKTWIDVGGKKRLGAVSAFGMSGTNVHVVLESYHTESSDKNQSSKQEMRPYYLLTFSAKTQEALKEKIEDMLECLEAAEDLGDGVLTAVSYTLLEGRQHFGCRLAIVVKDLEDAICGLKQAVMEENLPSIVKGKVEKDFRPKEAICKSVEDLVKQTLPAKKDANKYSEILTALAEFYCLGYEKYFNGFFGEEKPYLLNLPTYPFAKEKYWVPADKKRSVQKIEQCSNLHMLLHENTSDLRGQRFSSMFYGNENFLVCNGNSNQKILPESAYFEIARAAIAISTDKKKEMIALNDIAICEPLMIGENGEMVHISLNEGEQDEIEWEVYHGSEEEGIILAHGIGQVIEQTVIDKQFDILQLEASIVYEINLDNKYEKVIEEIHATEKEPISGSGHILIQFRQPDGDMGQDYKEAAVLDPVTISTCLSMVTMYLGKQKPLELVEVKSIKAVAEPKTIHLASIHYEEDKNELNDGWKLNIEFLDENEELISSMEEMKFYQSTNIEQEPKEETVVRADMTKTGKGRREVMKGMPILQCILWELRDIVGTLLKIPEDKLDINDNLENFGFNSISLIELAVAISECYDMEITPEIFYSYPTLKKLGGYFLANYADKMEAFYQEGTEAKEKQEIEKDTKELINNSKKPMVKRVHQNRNKHVEENSEPIAIIGMSGRFPDARNVEELWSILANGREAVHTISEERLKLWNMYGTLENGQESTMKMGLIPGAAEFDPLFFEISPWEAELMDPRQRLLLEETWKVLEEAGYGDKLLSNEKIGMFVGVEDGDYRMLAGEENTITSNHNGVLAARLAYFLNLHGPNMAINTACSSGLVAIHQACQSLRNNECDMAIVAGVNLMVAPNGYLGMEKAGMLSDDGKCYAFDKRANGMVPSEAIAVVALKKVSKAEKDCNPIYAAIVGSGINYDGKTNGITAPSGAAQTNLYKEVYERFHIHPEDISYIVTHGTGTKLGDPIEINALVDGFKDYHVKEGSCALTSTKPNIGHSLAASGVVSLISLALSLKNQMIPASINCEMVNDYIHWENSPFYINQENKEWTDIEGKRRLGAVNAFGMSGTNAHVVLESYTSKSNCKSKQNVQVTKKPFYLLAFSAKTKEALQIKVEDMVNKLEAELSIGNIDLSAVSYTLLEGRLHFGNRLAVVVKDMEDAIKVLKQIGTEENISTVVEGTVSKNFIVNEDTQKEVEDVAKRLHDMVDEEEKYQINLHKLAEYYCQGYENYMDGLWDEEKTKRISIPTYPFNNHTYWVEKENRQKDDIDVCFLHGTWMEQGQYSTKGNTDYSRKLMIFCDMESIIDEVKYKEIDTETPVSFIHLCCTQGETDVRYQTLVCDMLEQIKNVLAEKSEGKILIQVVTPGKDKWAFYSGLSGLLKTAEQENPKLITQLIEIDTALEPKEISYQLMLESDNVTDNFIRYQSGRRYVYRWSQVDHTMDTNLPWKEGGNYLITGGAGGLGLIFAREIAVKTRNVTLILAGRSTINERIQRDLEEIKRLGARVLYYQMDVTDEVSVQNTIQEIVQVYGNLNGIIHAAGLIKDGYIIAKKNEDVTKVLAPKVTGVVNLDKTTKDIPLDFFIVFASAAGSMGNAGQADYAAANAFLDAYVTYRNELVEQGERSGKTLSIDWPLWQDGGMSVSKEIQKITEETTGLIALPTDRGIQAFYNCYNSDFERVTCLAGNPNILQRKIEEITLQDNDDTDCNDTEEGKEVDMKLDETIFKGKVNDCLKQILSSVLKLPVQYIDTDAELEEYGIDSILAMKLTNELEKTFGILSKTLFYEYQTIGQLSEYFIKDHSDKLSELLDLQVVEKGTTQVIKEDTGNHSSTEGSKIKKSQIPKQQSADIKQEEQGALDIAIVGLSGKYPKAGNVEEFWNNISNGMDCITETAKERWDNSIYFDEEKGKFGKTNSKWGGFIDGVDQFDPMFFNISPREAETMDPQERLFLECVYETIEDAGYTRENLGENRKLGESGNVGVYVGVTYLEYQLYGAQHQSMGNMLTYNGSAATIANRVSYYCNFHGPSIALDTMCSSSLSAIHLACQSIRLGECEAAIAGGVNLSIHLNKYLLLSRSKFLSGKGQCRAFGDGGDGYVPGEGVGAVLLKPLSKAVADGDHIYGVIKGSAVNHGGKTNGYSVPNPNAQSKAIEKALKDAKINPRTISCIEAHGTGTSLGDPIEIAGLTKVFEQYTTDKSYCSIGSVKSNIGHCESAAGVAGLTKVLMQMKYGKLAPSLHSKVLNPYIEFEKTPFVVQQELSDWARPVIYEDGVEKEYPRRAGISSFGAGGSNAHLVVEEYKAREVQQTTKQKTVIIVLSAKSQEQLKEQAVKLTKSIKDGRYSEHNLDSIAYTLQVGREAMDYRLGMTVLSLKQLEEKLDGFIEGLDLSNMYQAQVKRNNEIFMMIDGEKDVLIENCLKKGHLDNLIKLWVNGLNVDWNLLYKSENMHPCRISLPTYPFAKERYWVESLGSPMAQTKEASAGSDETTVTAEQTVGSVTKHIDNVTAPVMKITKDTGISLKESTEECIIGELKDIVNHILKVPQEKIDTYENLENFGFDSISLVEFAGVLNEHFATDITPDVFYSYSTLDKLTDYLITEYSEKVKSVYQQNKAVEKEKEIALQPREEVEPVVEDALQDRIQEVKPVEVQLNRNVESNQTVGENSNDQIAVIGMSGRFPSARNIDELWSILEEGKEVINNVTDERAELWNTFGPWEDEAECNPRMGLVPGIAEFDPDFFEISPREAIMMDPRQRIMLEETWKALEDAGYGKEALANNKIGMFVGAEDGDYRLLVGDEGSITSNHNGVLAARLAYFLNLDGPNMAINTACSSGLMALHQACLSLRSGDCDTAIVAGANLLIAPSGYLAMEKSGMLSQDGKCYAFDERANGMVPSEAIAVVVLKRLAKAEKDHDRIYAAIVGSGTNYDGKTNGITAPSGYAQTKLLKDVYNRFHINPEDISYIVTHGTGTKLGDPIEINALANAFKEYTNKEGSCALTSTKSNIGHALAASGIVSLISLVMALKNEMIPAEINCEHVNNYIHWENSPFYINHKKKEWKDIEGKRRLGGVSAFGMSGTNVHAVLQSYHSDAYVKEDTKPYYLLTFSAKTNEALHEKIREFVETLEEDKTIGDTELTRVSYTLIGGRQHFNYRLAVVVKDKLNAIKLLKQAITKEDVANVVRGSVARNFKCTEATQLSVHNLAKQSCGLQDNVEEYKKNLDTLAEYYCLGYDNFEELFGKDKPVIISLPTYPFTKKTYWAHLKNDSMKSKSQQESKVVLEDLQIVSEKMSDVNNDVKQEHNKNILMPLDSVQDIYAVTQKTKEKPKIVLCDISEEKNIKPSKQTTNTVNMDEIINELSVSLANELFIDVEEIDLEKSFVELGMDSIIGVEWIRSINKKYGVTISTTKMYQYPNLYDFAEYLVSQLDFGVAGNEVLNELPETIVNELSVSLAKELFIDVEEIDLEKSFMELGMDSIIGVEWIRSINKQYGLCISTTKMYQYPNLYEFAEYLVTELDSGAAVKEVPAELPKKIPAKLPAKMPPKAIKKEETLDNIVKELSVSLAKELFIDVEEIDLEKSFMELGMDSIIGVEWIRSINKQYDVSISTTKMYQYPNLYEFAEYLNRKLNQRMPNCEEKQNHINDLLRQVYQGKVDIANAKTMIYESEKEV